MRNRIGKDRAAARWIGLLAIALLAAAPVAAQEVWVKDEVRINLRTGPGNEFRILDSLGTGDAMRIVTRGDGWTQVRLGDGREGWVPAGFLMETPPATTLVPRMEEETRELRETVASLRDEVATLRGEHGRLETSESVERNRAQQLEAENLRLRAGARWPEWITGAGILVAGMLVGSIVQTWASRRPRSRIRL